MRKSLILLSGSLSLLLIAACGAPPPPEPEEPAAASSAADDASRNDPSSISEGDLSAGGQGAGQPAQSSLEALQQGTVAAEGELLDVYFDFDRSELAAEARDILQRNSDWIKRQPGVTIEIEGHADNRGTNEYNLALGARRAQAVKDYLVTLGNAPDRLSTISYGEELPVCGVNSEECWRKNRRAHFVVRTDKPAS